MRNLILRYDFQWFVYTDFPTSNRPFQFKELWHCRTKYRKHHSHQLMQKNGSSWPALSLEDISVQLQGNYPSTLFHIRNSSAKKKEYEANGLHTKFANNHLRSSLPVYPSMCSSALMQFTMSYLITVWADNHAYTVLSPMRTGLVEVLWLAFCTSEPKNLPKRVSIKSLEGYPINERRGRLWNGQGHAARVTSHVCICAPMCMRSAAWARCLPACM